MVNAKVRARALPRVQNVAGVGDDRVVNACPSCEQLLDVTDQEPFSKVDCPACGEAIRVRTIFNHFQLEKQIGEGGMSRVFLAEDIALGRHDALKILNLHYSRDAVRIEQFEREATITASISHPNVVKVYSVGRDQGYFYIAMELVGGGSVDELIRDQGRVEVGKAVQIGVQVAQGLRAAHAAGLIHRDVKPGNILLSEEGTAKIVDFGLALMYGQDKDESGEIWATPYYVPPEKLDGGPEDFRSDIYSLGASLFHALAGKPPFAADTASIAELKKLKAQPIGLASAARHVPAVLCEVVDRAMAIDPVNRYDSYDDLLDHLYYARKSIRGGGGTHGGAKNRAGMPSRRVLMGVGLGGAAAVGLAAILLVAAGNGEGVPPERDVVLMPMMDAVPLAVARGSVSDRFVEGRQEIISGDFAAGVRTFRELIAMPGVPHPTLEWCFFHAALGSVLQGDLAASRSLFGSLARGAEASDDPEYAALMHHFATTGQLGASENPVVLADTDPLESGDDLASVGLFPLGVKNWFLGDAESARALLEAFCSAIPPESRPWIADYQRLAETFLRDAELVLTMPALGGDLGGYEAALATVGSAEMLAQDLVRDDGAAGRLLGELARARASLAGLKAAEDEARARMATELSVAEFDVLRKLVSGLHQDDYGLDFEPAINVLRDTKFETAEVEAALDDERELWQLAAAFVDGLIDDFNELGYEGEIYRGEGRPLIGKVLSASRDGIRVSAAGREGTVTLDEIPPVGLVSMAETLLDSVADSDGYYRRREQIVAFSHVMGMRGYTEGAARQLARESRPFRERWERLAAAGLL
ncbi:hypothetical protein BH23VER1_BH23VER1_01330 [soil metagenome]